MPLRNRSSISFRQKYPKASPYHAKEPPHNLFIIEPDFSHLKSLKTIFKAYFPPRWHFPAIHPNKSIEFYRDVLLETKMQITFEISKVHVCQDNVCFKTTFVLVKNMTDKVILGLHFITLLYPFTTDQDGLITYLMDEKVKFEFLAKPERSQLNAFKSNSISKSVNLIKSKAQHIEFLQEEDTVLELLAYSCLVLTKSLSISSIFSTKDLFLLTFKLIPDFGSGNLIIGFSCLKGLCFSFERSLFSSFSSILSNWFPMEFRYWLV